MITVKNEFLTASFNELGAELKSLKCDGKEYIWEGNPEFWTGSAPVLFPICSGLLDDEYNYNGKTYTMKKHGFARHKVFTVKEKHQNSVTFSLESDAETLAQYPFQFELLITYTLIAKKLTVTYNVVNKTNGSMYFSIGAHEAYATPDGINNYSVILPEKETLVSSVLEGNVIGNQTELILQNGDILPLNYEYFAVDALVFKQIKARSVILTENSGKRKLKVEFNGFNYLLLWTKPNAPYICIEPWCGISDNANTNKDFTTKEGIYCLNKGETFTREHSIEILG